jgi:hypothetical protein
MLFESVVEEATRAEVSCELGVCADHRTDVGLHLAVTLEPYLRFILDGSKEVESRFSRNGCAPFERVVAGDVVLLKRSSGPIVGFCRVSDVWNYRLTPGSLDTIKDRFGAALCPQPGFWEQRRDATYATLMRVDEVQRLPEMAIPKRDRRGWVVLRDSGVTGLL